MEWVSRLVEATHWNVEPGQFDWLGVEEALGVALPDDFKELRRLFPEWGAFDDHIFILEAQNSSESVTANHESLLQSVRSNPDNLRVFRPYGLFRAGVMDGVDGLLQWGYSLIDEEYYWLVNESVDPSAWPVMARTDPLEPFQRFEMTASEFLFRVLTDPEFSEFSIAATIERPYYSVY